MGKVVNYIEFLKMIKDKQIKAGTKLKIMGEIFYYNGSCILRNDNHERLASYLWECNLINTDVEIISEDEEIDIDSINEFGTNEHKGYISYSSTDNEKESELRKYIVNNVKDIKVLIKAVKQINKQMKEK